jgi:hypothetical protein
MLRASSVLFRATGGVSPLRGYLRQPFLWAMDRSGTTEDSGGFRVKKAMLFAWQQSGYEIQLSDIQKGMGTRKDNHFDMMSVCMIPQIRKKYPNASSVEIEKIRIDLKNIALKNYLGVQKKMLEENKDDLLIPKKMGVIATLANMNPQLIFGYNTGFYLQEAAVGSACFKEAKIIAPSRVVEVTGSDVDEGRPSPKMLCNLTRQAITRPEERKLPAKDYNVSLCAIPPLLRKRVVTADDTEEGIWAGKAFGGFTILTLENSCYLQFQCLEEMESRPDECQRQIDRLIESVARPLQPDYVTTDADAWLEAYKDICHRLTIGSVPGDMPMATIGADRVVRRHVEDLTDTQRIRHR